MDNRLVFWRSDIQAVIMAALETGRLLAGRGDASSEYVGGYLAALRLVAVGFGFQVAQSGPEVLSVGVPLVETHVR